MKKNIWLAVIAGGQGTRLFPLSHDSCPKQFCQLSENETFIQATVRRFSDLLASPKRVVVVITNDRQLELATKQLVSMGVLSINIVKIPGSHGYAGAMIKAAEYIHRYDPEAIIVNTPADQYIADDKRKNFDRTMKLAIEGASLGDPVIVGVDAPDLVTVMGCGHATYSSDDLSKLKEVSGFIEKPKEEEAIKLMRKGNSACNTGINVWQSSLITEVMADYLVSPKKSLNTDDLMKKFNKIKLAIGHFSWFDCGTLKSFYEISKKTPNHKNVSFGEVISRTQCRESLFITIKGVSIYATGIKNTAIVANEISGKMVVAIVKLSESQKVRDLAEDYRKNKRFLTHDFSMGARNNRVSRTNLSVDLAVGFVGVSDHSVTAIKQLNGEIIVIVSNDHMDMDDISEEE